jgi:hypothetical protein
VQRERYHAREFSGDAKRFRGGVMKGPDFADVLSIAITIFGMLFLFFVVAGLIFG